MTKTEIKEFIKNHKKEIIFGVGTIAVGVLCVICGKEISIAESNVADSRRAVEKITKDKDMQFLFEMSAVIDRVKGDATKYIPLYTEEFAALFGDNNIITAPNGEMMKVAGAILFGNELVER